MTQGEFIKRERLKRGLSQKALATRLGFHSQFISNIERNQALLPPTHIKTVAKELGTSAHRLLDLYMRDQKLKIQQEIL